MTDDNYRVGIGSAAPADIALHASHARLEAEEPIPVLAIVAAIAACVIGGFVVKWLHDIMSEDELARAEAYVIACLRLGGSIVPYEHADSTVTPEGGILVIDDRAVVCQVSPE